MGRGSAGHIRVALLGLLPCLGCATASMTAPLAPLTAPATAKLTSSSAKPSSPDLPPAEAADLCVTLARQLEREGHEPEAVGQYELARHYRADVDVARRLAVLYDRLGNAGRAMPEYERALKEHPKDADLLNDLGYHHYNLGRWADAEKYLHQALDVNPKHANAWTNLGMTLAQEGKYKESLAAFGHCVSPAEAQCNLAFLLTTQGKREEAKATYREALRLDPKLRLAQAALAKLEEPAAPPVAQQTRKPAVVAAATPAPGAEARPPAFAQAYATVPLQAPKPAPPAAETLRTAASSIPAPTLPTVADLPAGKSTSGWVIPAGDAKPERKPEGDATVAVAPPPAPTPSPAAAPATPASTAESDTSLRWVPPPPVPQPNLPADLVPVGPRTQSTPSLVR